MTQENGHPTVALQELLDERLAGSQRAEVESHVAECDRCRRELEVLRWTRQTLRDAATAEPLPATLEHELQGALDREDAGAGRPAPPARPAWLRPLAVAAVLAVVAVALTFLRPTADVPSRSYMRNSMPLLERRSAPSGRSVTRPRNIWQIRICPSGPR
jgi:anti-sigma factor RsiW